MFRQVCILLITGLLVACAGPNQLGLSQTQWRQLTPSEQSKQLAMYQQIKAWNEKRADRARALPVDPKGAVMRAIVVSIKGGTVMLPPYVAPRVFKPIAVKLAPNQCQLMTVAATPGDVSVQSNICYLNHVLSLDPSHRVSASYDGTVFFHQNPQWVDGFTYVPVNTAGYLRFSGASVEVKQDA